MLDAEKHFSVPLLKSDITFLIKITLKVNAVCHRWPATHIISQYVLTFKMSPCYQKPKPSPLNTLCCPPPPPHHTLYFSPTPPVSRQDGPPVGDPGGRRTEAAAASLSGGGGGEDQRAAGGAPSPGPGAGQTAAKFLRPLCPRRGAHWTSCPRRPCCSG